MSGSGNDFVVFDARKREAEILALESPEIVRTLCARRTGVGADGVVFVARTEHREASVAMRYYNSDGSRGAFCGNATLCVTTLSRALGVAIPKGLLIETDAGPVAARIGGDGRPEIDLAKVIDVAVEVGSIETAPGEQRIGFALAGVPHLVVRCDDVDRVDVEARGRVLRHDAFRADGANVNFVSGAEGRWRIRTFERGVEGETLACGSGAVASAIVLNAWSESRQSTSLRTASGLELAVRLSRDAGAWQPSLSGEGRVVFTGVISQLSDLSRS